MDKTEHALKAKRAWDKGVGPMTDIIVHARFLVSNYSRNSASNYNSLRLLTSCTLTACITSRFGKVFVVIVQRLSLELSGDFPRKAIETSTQVSACSNSRRQSGGGNTRRSSHNPIAVDIAPPPDVPYWSPTSTTNRERNRASSKILLQTNVKLVYSAFRTLNVARALFNLSPETNYYRCFKKEYWHCS